MSYFKKSSQEVNKVYKTNDLSMFKEIEGNRPPNPQHIRRLADSIKTNGLLCNPILVNEKYEVIDGQHRLLAAKKVNSEIYFIVLDGYNLNEVHTLNLNQKNWNKKDFMIGYADMGIEPYIKLKEFYKKNKDYTLNTCIQLCSQVSGFSTVNVMTTKYGNEKKINTKKVFEEGTWTGKDFKWGQKVADDIRLVKPYYKHYNRSSFVSCIISLRLYKKEVFDFNEFLHKLRLQPTALVDCTTVGDYKTLIEDIYNYKRHGKVNLRY